MLRAWFLTALCLRLKGRQTKKQIEVELTADDTGFLMLEEKFPSWGLQGTQNGAAFCTSNVCFSGCPTLLLADLHVHTKLKKKVIREHKKPYCM